MIPIPGPLVEFLLLGPVDDRRQLQDSPILADVWVEFGKNPAQSQDLLISPYPGQHAGLVASTIEYGVNPDRDAEIAFLSSLVVARLTFRELVQLVVPKTWWWIQRWHQDVKPTRKRSQKGQQKRGEVHDLASYSIEALEGVFMDILVEAKQWHLKVISRSEGMPALDRFLALTGLFLWADNHVPDLSQNSSASAVDLVTYIIDNAEPPEIARLLIELGRWMLQDPTREPLISQVSLNRLPLPALTRSIQAVKADAAHTLFKVNCSKIIWGVIDSGIDGNHPAFGGRVRRTFDFKNFRKIVSLSNAKESVRNKNIDSLMSDPMWAALKSPPNNPEFDLKILADNARTRGPIHWELVEKFIELRADTPPLTSHGTHVAGVIGASRDAAKAAAGRDDIDFADGMCPDIQLYDFRVLGRDIKDAEFAIIAALHFIRDLNERNNFITIQGVNLSLSIPHDVRNFACGRTPICIECERLIESGVVVVAAAGNNGYKSFETSEGSYSSYTAFSITDPGNADSVITVGATHGFSPHTYGVSFFSSRGPTGDGRRKPDLVAPGERIRAPILGGEWGDLDGTSIAAPHVSGAAAMLMARYSELIGQPRRIKRMLCETATDLGRDRSFQGNGMLDVLRAFQSF